MQTAGKPSYYDPEGETIYLSSPAASEAGAAKKRRRGPELNDVLGYVGSATLLVAYLFVANQILRKHPVVVDCMNLFGSACVRFGAEISPRRLRVNLHAIDATSARCTGGLQLLLQEGLRPHVPRDLLVRHRVRCDGEALHISLLLQEGRTGITRGQGGTRLRSRRRLRR